MPETPWKSILVATGWQRQDEAAFLHGLALARAAKARFTVAHVGDDAEGGIPGIREVLTRWGDLAPGADRAEVSSLGIHAMKVRVDADDAPSGIAFEADTEHVDLVVLGHRHRSGIESMLDPSLAAQMVRALGRPTLVVPADARGFVDPATGRLALGRVVIAVDNVPSALPALDVLDRLQATAGPAELVSVHVGSDSPHLPGIARHIIRPLPSIVDGLLDTVEEEDATLLVLVVGSRRSLADAVFGSTVERVLARTHGAVLCIPE